MSTRTAPTSLAYDAARQACTALLSHQGLRPTTDGGHYVVEEAVRAQFGDLSRAFGALRRRRNELEYVAVAGDRAEPTEVAAALASANQLIDTAAQIMPNLSLF